MEKRFRKSIEYSRWDRNLALDHRVFLLTSVVNIMTGVSVQEVIDTARRVTGWEIPLQDATHREGDPPRLVANASLAKAVLGWQPRHAELETIIAHAWRWEQNFFCKGNHI